jgi:hypothetical protein
MSALSNSGQGCPLADLRWASNALNVCDGDDALFKDRVQRAAGRSELPRVDEEERHDPVWSDEDLKEHARDRDVARADCLDRRVAEHGAGDEVDGDASAHDVLTNPGSQLEPQPAGAVEDALELGAMLVMKFTS